MKRLLLFLFLIIILSSCENSNTQGDPFAPAFEAFGVVLVATLFGRFLARKLNLSLVLGEVLMGVIVGTILSGLGRPGIAVIRNQKTIQEIIAKVDRNIPLDSAIYTTLESSAISTNEKEVLRETLSTGRA